MTWLRDLEENGVLSLQTPHLRFPGPKEANNSLRSERGRGLHRCAQKGTSTWLTHSHCHRQTAVPHSCKKPPLPLTPHTPCSSITGILQSHTKPQSQHNHTQGRHGHTQSPRSYTHMHVHACTTHTQLQRVTETENRATSQVPSHIRAQESLRGDLKASNIPTVTERATQ